MKTTKGFSANTLKLIAIVAMTIDHLASLLYPGFPKEPLPLVMHLIGRLTAPIMIYFIAEGYFHTRNVKKYIGRLLLFAAISHIPYILMFGGEFTMFGIQMTSVMLPFAMGLSALAVDQSKDPRLTPVVKSILVYGLCALAFFSDWSMPGAMAVVFVGRNHGNFKRQMLGLATAIAMYATVYAFSFDMVYGILQMGIVLSFPLLALYNQTRGKARWLKWFFYIYYPAHLLILGLIRIYG